MTKDKIIENLNQYICTRILRDPTFLLAADAPLFSAGIINSFAFVTLLAYIEGHFGVYLPDEELATTTIDTLSEIADRILQDQP